MSLQFRQKTGRFKSTFDFGEEELTYTFDNSNRKAGTSVSYDKIPLRRSHSKEHLWQLKYLVICFVLTYAIIFFDYFRIGTKDLFVAVWPAVAMVCVSLRFMYQLPNASGTQIPLNPPLVVLDNGQHDAILAEIDKRYLESVRKKYGTVNFDRPYYDELRKFNWLKNFDLISQQEYMEARKKIAAMRNKNTIQPTHTHNIN